MIGTYVICRCSSAGVHAGILHKVKGDRVVLKESRRLWFWKAANKAAFLSGIATEGLDPSSKVGAPIKVRLSGVCEIIECTEKAKKSIKGAPNYEA